VAADNTTSILDSIKKMIGIDKDYDAFDIDIIIHINSAFSKLTQMGVGPTEGYEIDTSDNTWDEILAGNNVLSWCRTFVYLSVKMMFDPNLPGPVIGAYERQIEELTWRITVAAETDKIPVPSDSVPVTVFMWTLDANENFPPEAEYGDYGFSAITGNVFRKT